MFPVRKFYTLNLCTWALCSTYHDNHSSVRCHSNPRCRYTRTSPCACHTDRWRARHSNPFPANTAGRTSGILATRNFQSADLNMIKGRPLDFQGDPGVFLGKDFFYVLQEQNYFLHLTCEGATFRIPREA